MAEDYGCESVFGNKETSSGFRKRLVSGVSSYQLSLPSDRAGLSTLARSGQVAVASSGLIPQLLWISGYSRFQRAIYIESSSHIGQSQGIEPGESLTAPANRVVWPLHGFCHGLLCPHRSTDTTAPSGRETTRDWDEAPGNAHLPRRRRIPP